MKTTEIHIEKRTRVVVSRYDKKSIIYEMSFITKRVCLPKLQQQQKKANENSITYNHPSFHVVTWLLLMFRVFRLELCLVVFIIVIAHCFFFSLFFHNSLPIKRIQHFIVNHSSLYMVSCLGFDSCK